MESETLLENTRDNRQINLNWVGIRGMTIPAVVDLCPGKEEICILSVDYLHHLDASRRGTDMTRIGKFIQEKLSDNHLNPDHLETLTEHLKDTPEKDISIHLVGESFVERMSPVSSYRGKLNVRVEFRLIKKEGKLFYQYGVGVPVVSCCPGSKKQAKVSAHSQRGYIFIQLQNSRTHLAELIRVAQDSGCDNVYPILSGKDDAYITVKAYENAKFVEDVVKDTVLTIKGIWPNCIYRVFAENEESIHNHAVYAESKHENFVIVEIN